MSVNTGPFSEAVQWSRRSKVPMLHMYDLNPVYQFNSKPALHF